MEPPPLVGSLPPNALSAASDALRNLNAPQPTAPTLVQESKSSDKTPTQKRVDEWLELPKGALTHPVLRAECMELSAVENWMALNYGVRLMLMEEKLQKLPDHVRLLWIIRDNLEVLVDGVVLDKGQEVRKIDTLGASGAFKIMPPMSIYQGVSRVIAALETVDASSSTNLKLMKEEVAVWKRWLAAFEKHLGRVITVLEDSPKGCTVLPIPQLINELWQEKKVLRMTVQRCGFVIFPFSAKECTFALNLVEEDFVKTTFSSLGYKGFCDITDLSDGAQKEFERNRVSLRNLLKKERFNFLQSAGERIVETNMMLKMMLSQFPSEEAKNELYLQVLLNPEFLNLLFNQQLQMNVLLLMTNPPQFEKELEGLPAAERDKIEKEMGFESSGDRETDDIIRSFLLTKVVHKIREYKKASGIPFTETGPEVFTQMLQSAFSQLKSEGSVPAEESEAFKSLEDMFSKLTPQGGAGGASAPTEEQQEAFLQKLKDLLPKSPEGEGESDASEHTPEQEEAFLHSLVESLSKLTTGEKGAETQTPPPAAAAPPPSSRGPGSNRQEKIDKPTSEDVD